MRTTWPLVGREDELQFVAAALEADSPAGVVLVGPPGVGKTRLATEAAIHARASGFGTASGRANFHHPTSLPLGGARAMSRLVLGHPAFTDGSPPDAQLRLFGPTDDPSSRRCAGSR